MAKSFDIVAERLKKANVNNYYLSAELEKAKEAIPVQTEDFVSRTEHEKVKQALESSERLHHEKDRIIDMQQDQIKDLTQRVKELTSKCVDFIKEHVSKSFDLMNSLAQKLNLVKDVNESIKQDKEREERAKKIQRRSRDDWEMER